MMQTVLAFFVVCLATVSLAQPGITIDESLPCWLNLTGDMNVTYNEDILAAIDEYINETLIDAAASLPMDEQAILVATQILPVEKELLYVIAPPISLGDFYLVTRQAPLLASLAYPKMVQSPEYIRFLLGTFESFFYVCVDGEEIPDYSYIIQQVMELVFVGFASAFEPVSLVEPIIDQAAIAIAEDWNFTTNAGSRFDLILPDLVEGLNVGWKKLNNTEIDIDGIADRMAESVLALKFEDHNSTDAVGLAQEVIAELGLEVSQEFVNQMMALVEAYDLEDGN